MIILIFILGLMIGSFINCVIYRLHIDQSFLKGRSYCPYCKHQLEPEDLIPIYSFIILKGKCRYCQAKISWQYPIVEFITALIFVLIYFVWSKSPVFGYLVLYRNLFFAASLIVIFIYDFKYQLVSDQIVIWSAIIAFLSNLWLGISWLNLLIGAIIGSSFFLAQYLISKGKWIGLGDAYLGFLMGIMLGWQRVVLAVMLAYLIGSITAVILVLLKKEEWKSKIALGPFLAIGTFIVLLYGEAILNWYLAGF